MITITKLSEKDLEIFCGKQVILYTKKDAPVALYQVLCHLGINVIACCPEKIYFEKYIKMKASGMSVVKPMQLRYMAEKNDNLIIQADGFSPEEFNDIRSVSNKYGIDFAEISSGEIVNSFSHLVVFKTLRNPLSYHIRSFFWKCSWKCSVRSEWLLFQCRKPTNPVIICSPPKTADFTLVNTFENLRQLEPLFEYYNVWHQPRRINAKLCEKAFGKLRVIVGVREPISQNISAMFQNLSGGSNFLYDWMLGLLEGKSEVEKAEILSRFENTYAQGEDAQVLWDEFVMRYIYPVSSEKLNAYHPLSIRGFLLEFTKHVLDITEYPFDQEKGFAIIKKDNVEVFVYQLEKLNCLVPELSEWVGIPFDKLENGNQASDKWISESYKHAQKEIKITQEYFDACFNESYVKHCYSEKDIKAFKQRWRGHIKND